MIETIPSALIKPLGGPDVYVEIAGKAAGLDVSQALVVECPARKKLSAFIAGVHRQLTSDLPRRSHQVIPQEDGSVAVSRIL